MITDVSEIKEFRHCKRKWQLSSRNSFHLTPCVTPPAFKMGTVFHECLHKLYLGKDEAEVEKYCTDQMKYSFHLKRRRCHTRSQVETVARR